RILFTALMLVVPLIGFSQSNNWLSTVDLNVSVSSSDHIDLYTDQEGNHVIVHKSNQLTYYLFSATGSQIRTSTIDNFSESPRLSRIIGHGENLYISYKKGSTIKTEKSTDSGATWSTTDVDDIALSNNQVNGLEVWTDANGLHLVHSEWNDNDLVYNSFYQRVPHNNNEWTDFKQVTDETNVAGGFPSVTTSSNRVHVAFTDSEGSIPGDGAGDPRSRDRSSSTWQSSYLITSPDDPAYCSIIANNSKLHAFYYIPDPLVHILKHRTRSLSGGSWSATEITLESGANAFEPIDMAVSADDQVHIFYNDGSGQYNVWNNTTNWGSEFTPTST
ncbi:MAG: hypothetical protein GWN61_24410, partial [candidate division Zixibacteria bacterium]|nr:hypothetical protein [candidate division Zixibacteria bacterium]NIS49008.1 hypothetical protein [candidate division Zixibacteria bacterium]NIU17090.1 hypothetical protein [candidate division Zixibacteria bacterium]NIV09231.1 hypothetical protein [candidate division Zixibacteria bacterium]NIW50114.1 hypothetical protein [Gammaproteobacteria bacterium]